MTELLVTGTVPAAIFAVPDHPTQVAGSCFFCTLASREKDEKADP
jgi:hypothetical protein